MIDRNRGQPGTGHGQRQLRTGVSGLFHPDTVAGVQQHMGDELQGLLRARRDHDLRRLAAHAAKRPQILRDSLTERHVAHRFAVREQVPRRLAPVSVQQPGPYAERQVVERRKADPECSEVFQPGSLR